MDIFRVLLVVSISGVMFFVGYEVGKSIYAPHEWYMVKSPDGECYGVARKSSNFLIDDYVSDDCRAKKFAVQLLNRLNREPVEWESGSEQ